MPDRAKIKKEFQLKGRLITHEDPSHIADNFQTMTNLRYRDNHPKGIAGMTKINSSVMDSTYLKPRRIKQFRKTRPEEDHILVEAYNTGLTASVILDNKTAVPSTGNFESTALYTSTGSETGYFSPTPTSSLAYCNGTDTVIWGGDEHEVGGFVNYDPTDAFSKDYTTEVRNTLTDAQNVAVISDAADGKAYIYLGSIFALQGFKCTISVGNSVGASTMSVDYWNGSAWTSVSTLVDGTSDGTDSLAQTGSVTFDSTISTAKTSYLQGVFLFWYRITISDLNTATITNVTVDAPFQQLKDIWDGAEREVTTFIHFELGKDSNETLKVRSNNYIEYDEGSYANLHQLESASDYLLVGFYERTSGIKFNFVDDKTNATGTASITVEYWTGSAWASVGDVVDGTSISSRSMSQTGVISWNSPDIQNEFQKSTNNDNLMYLYKLTWSENLVNTQGIKVYYVSGIPAQKTISSYKFPLLANDRLWLLNDNKERKNKATCSAENTSVVFNGDDSVEIEFGDDSDLTGGAWLYSQYGSSVYSITMFFKSNETWALIGSTPDKWVKYRVSETIGCAAPDTIRVIGIGSGDPKIGAKSLVIWQGTNGIYMSDGRTPIEISRDIRDIFDKNVSTSINTAKIADSSAFWDSERQEYHFLYASGTSTTIDKELVFSFQRSGWFEIDRGTNAALQCGSEVKDSSGNTYTYGGIDTGYLERLENGTDFDGNDIVHTLQLGDIALHNGSILTETQVEYHALVATAKSNTSNNITTTHYVDSETTSDKTFTSSPQKSGRRLIFPVEHKGQGTAVFHSWKFTITTNDETIGFEPLYFGVIYNVARDKVKDWR